METKYKVILTIIYVIGVLAVYGILYFMALSEELYPEYSFDYYSESERKLSLIKKIKFFFISLLSWLFFLPCVGTCLFETIKTYFKTLKINNHD